MTIPQKWSTVARTKEAAFLLENLDLDMATDEPGAVWNEMAIAQLNTPPEQLLTIDNKCRQGGWSFNEAARSVAHGIIVPRSMTIFVSYNQTESKEKIVYAKRVIEALHPAVRPGLASDSTEELKFSNGSRLRSLPCRDPRGPGKPVIDLDEAAFYGPRDMEIFRAAIGALSRGGSIRMGSTPRPAGLFRELADPTQADKTAEGKIADLLKGAKPVVREWPWWYFPHLAKDLASARVNAPHLTTEQRVERYGTDRLHLLWAGYAGIGDIGGFQQEFECMFVSETAALIGWSWIRTAQSEYDMGDTPTGGLTAIGADFARQQDQTAFVVVHYDSGRFTVVDVERMRGAQANEQAEHLIALCSKYKPYKVFGDVTDGYGRSVMEMARVVHPHIEGMQFSGPSKEEMIARVCAAFFNKQISIPMSERTLADDIASVRRVQKVSGHVGYESPRNSKGHADSFWALALALRACPAAVGGAMFSYKSVEKREIAWSGPESMRQGTHFGKDGQTMWRNDKRHRGGGGFGDF